MHRTMVAALLLLAACGEDEACTFDAADTLGELTAWEQAWVASGERPELPEPSFLAAEDDLPLAYREWAPAGEEAPAHVALLVPGSSAHSGLYGVLGEGLAEAGVFTRIVDVRGHGLSVCAATGCGTPEAVDRSPADDGQTWVGRVGDSADVQQIVRDLGKHLADLRAAHPQAQLHLVGHSSGGGVVSRYVETTGAPMAASVALLAPYNHPDQPQVRDEVRIDCGGLSGTAYARVDLGALGDALRGRVHRFVLSLNKSERYTDPLDTLAYTYTTMTGMAATHPTDFWQAYDLPVLLVAAEEDHLLDPDRSVDQVERAREGQAWRVADTSHVGLSWSAEVAAGLASWMQTKEAP